MTPLAARLAKQLILPIRQRVPFWRENSAKLRSMLHDIHCFEVTQCVPMLRELADTLHSRFGTPTSLEDCNPEASDFIGSMVFLPAPKTWLEQKHAIGGRLGFLLEEFADEKWAGVTLFTDGYASKMGTLSLTSDDYKTPFVGEKFYYPKALDQLVPSPDKVPHALLACCHSFLMMINSPRIIGRRQIMPNAGLERRLTQKLGRGKFPLHAWTEIKLEVMKPIEIDDGEPHEAHLTGRRALHFCRKHIRIRNGRLEYVKAHWRGDPAVGIKQSRYVVTP